MTIHKISEESRLVIGSIRSHMVADVDFYRREATYSKEWQRGFTAGMERAISVADGQAAALSRQSKESTMTVSTTNLLADTTAALLTAVRAAAGVAAEHCDSASAAAALDLAKAYGILRDAGA